ncbi:uncharacterized protein EDB93DRAFT_1094566, partial [Suillus bovinus]|uniref:uncharacterized protein n=1 Tax=Suillus bovinus TaxID=48563 RepID=UPI001B87A5FB
MQNRFIPMPIGGGIPHQDRPEDYPRYCRLMLILFKPWRSVKDLRREDQSWELSFGTFLSACDIHFKNVMNNMQILHECRDSQD